MRGGSFWVMFHHFLCQSGGTQRGHRRARFVSYALQITQGPRLPLMSKWVSVLTTWIEQNKMGKECEFWEKKSGKLVVVPLQV